MKTIHDHVKTLNNYTEKITFSEDLAAALQKLYTEMIDKNKIPLYITDDDISLSHDTIMLTNKENVVDITDGNIKITYPYDKHQKMAPELRENTKIPFIINYETCYYSIGLLFLKIIFNSTNPTNLNKIQNTSIYYFIERCLDTNVNNRKLLFI